MQASARKAILGRGFESTKGKLELEFSDYCSLDLSLDCDDECGSLENAQQSSRLRSHQLGNPNIFAEFIGSYRREHHKSNAILERMNS